MTELSGFSLITLDDTYLLNPTEARAFLRIFHKVLTNSRTKGKLYYNKRFLDAHSDQPFAEAHPNGSVRFSARSVLSQIAMLINSISEDGVFDTPTDGDMAYLLSCYLAVVQGDIFSMSSFGCEEFTIRYSKFDSVIDLPEQVNGVSVIRPDNSLVIFGHVTGSGEILSGEGWSISIIDSDITLTAAGRTSTVTVEHGIIFLAFSYTHEEIWVTAATSTGIHDIILPLDIPIDYVRLYYNKYSRCIVSDMSDSVMFSASLHSDPMSYMETLL